MASAVWQVLGIAPTDDPTAIRRAYAVCLKRTRPDRDPAGFTQLRAAYEAALAQAAVPPTPPTTAFHDAGPAAEPAPAHQPPAPRVSPHIQAFAAALDARNATAASDALDDALRHGALPIQVEMQLSAALLELLVRQPDLPLALLNATAKRFNWNESATAAGNHGVALLQARIESEEWFAALRRQAGPLRFLGLSRPGAAQLLLGRGTFLYSWYLPPQPPLLDMLSALSVHGPWLRGRFDAVRIERVERLAVELRERSGTVRNASSFILSLLPAVAVLAAFGSIWGPILCFNFTRAVLARTVWLKRPFSIFGTLAAVAVIVFSWQAKQEFNPFQTGINLMQPAWRAAPPSPAALPAEILAASRQGDSDAMRTAGEMLLAPATTTQQTIRAAAWLGAAANRGNLQAMLDLDRLYLNMDGLLYDSPRAYFWSGVARRVARTLSDMRAADGDYARATAALYWKHRPELDTQIRAWRPKSSPLPE